MINSIVDHTNSYAQEKIFSGLGSSYTISDGSWQDVTTDEIRRFIAIFIHFSVVQVRGDDPEELEYEDPLPWFLGPLNPSPHEVFCNLSHVACGRSRNRRPSK